MKSKKLNLFGIIFIFSLLLNYSCLDAPLKVDDGSEILKEESQLIGLANTVFTDVDNHIEDIQSLSRVDKPQKAPSVVAMPKVTFEPEDPNVYPKTIYVDFGEDGMYFGRKGNYYQGVVIIYQNDFPWNYNAQQSYSFENFYVNFEKLEGKKITTNLNEKDNKRLDISQNFEWHKEKRTVTIDSHRLRERLSTNDTGYSGYWQDDIFSYTGESIIYDSEGNKYSITIKEPLVFFADYPYFVKGIYVLSLKGGDIIYDFGEGERDNIVYVTQYTGETYKKELNW